MIIYLATPPFKQIVHYNPVAEMDYPSGTLFWEQKGEIETVCNSRRFRLGNMQLVPYGSSDTGTISS